MFQLTLLTLIGCTKLSLRYKLFRKTILQHKWQIACIFSHFRYLMKNLL